MRRLKLGRDPLISKKRDHRTIHVVSSGMLTGSFAEVFSRVVLRSWVERSLITYSGPHHGVAETECAVGEFERDLPAVALLAHGRARAGR